MIVLSLVVGLFVMGVVVFAYGKVTVEQALGRRQEQRSSPGSDGAMERIEPERRREV